MLGRGGVDDTRLEAMAKAKDTKKSEAKAKAKNSAFEDRRSRGQGQICSRSRPRTKNASASALQKKKKTEKKTVCTKIFQAISRKKRLPNNFSDAPQILTIQKIVLSSNQEQASFGGLEALRPRPRTSKCVLEDVFEAKDVLENSTSDAWVLSSYSMLPPPGRYRVDRSKQCKIGDVILISIKAM